MKAEKKQNRSKSYEMKEAIKRDIIAGKYDKNDGQLPTCREFMKIFNVSYATANKAIHALKDEGYSKVIQGKGIFACRPTRKKSIKKAASAGFLMPHTGDLFQKLFSLTMRRLESHDIMSVPVFSGIENEKNPQFEQQVRIEKITAMGLDSLVIYGTRHLPYKILKKHYSKIRQAVFILNMETEIDFPGANFILTDFKKGGYLAADHLIKKGRKKLLYITFEKLNKELKIRNGVKSPNYDFEALEGMRCAMIENNLDPQKDISVIYDDSLAPDKSRITKKISSFIEAGGDGVVCLGDNRALKVFHAAKKTKKKIGKDIGVVGFYNTSWCEVFDPELTSVSICEKEIAKQVTSAISENWIDCQVTVQPELIIRNSG
ncbi:MAG: GntR family transcriptional regulator [Planctomycetota bacterium]|jgi:GntR family transcriptional regulator of arabinose operon